MIFYDKLKSLYTYIINKILLIPTYIILYIFFIVNFSFIEMHTIKL